MADMPFLPPDDGADYAVVERISPLVRRVLARNPSAFTAKGTATFIVGHGTVAVIDPGPDLPEHVDALLHALRGETVGHILVTHTHRDHSPAAAALQQATGAPTYGYGPHGGGAGPATEAGADLTFEPDHTLRDGDVVEGPGWRLTAVHTPGHTSNHLCFTLAEENTLFSGDHVMGWSTTVVTPQDGDMAAYLRSLEKLLAREEALYRPTHGPAITQPHRYVRALIGHRRQRSAAILKRLEAGDSRIPEVVAALYAGLPQGLQRAAARTVLAHLIEMIEKGTVVCDGPPTLDSAYRPLSRTRDTG